MQRLGGCGRQMFQGDKAPKGRHVKGLGLGAILMTTKGHCCSQVGKQKTETRWMWEVGMLRG